MKSLSDIIKTKEFNPDKRNSYEFQAYGNMLAEELGDQKHRALYIKLAKTEPRNLLEMARVYVKSSENALTRGRLFMWKLTELKKELKQRSK
ncbi:hypothetical protein A2619_02565 [candidate division WWE3 bacterium RIFOXYD1_FULL_39_9]|uniref:Uncharacterized protein n=1 Tax=candidate division WWE3 bacterium RIFOXYD1_FULL_39_9 TaxID=1802649 RepID=A0A1F4X5F3_UNCKA|nr:MAG: hypothetical protein A2619_02565 [candidate division WWE3 bacterium RIFOXYD1_FULL_39_9]